MDESLELTPIPTAHKKDPAWKHCQAYKDGEREHLKCIYCGKVFKGGGVYRLKEHLAGRKGGGPICTLVPPNVRLSMNQYLDGRTAKVGSQDNDEDESNSGSGLVHSQMQLPAPPVLDGNNNITPETGGPSKRRKKDVAWLHCEAIRNNDRVQIQCKYCSKIFKGGGIYRLKEHLSGRKGSAPRCVKVPGDVRLKMQQLLDELPVRSSKGQGADEMRNVVSPMDIFGNHHDDGNNVRSEAVDGYGSLEINLNSLLDQGGMSNDVERGKPSMTGLGSDDNNPIHLRIGRFLYDIGARFDALDSAFLASFNGLVNPRGSPSSRDLRGWVLKNLVKEVSDEIDKHKSTWGRMGCSIMVEERTSDYGRVLLNFMVQSSHGTVFLKSVDASSFDHSADLLYNVLKDVVEHVGSEHVLQVVTNVGEDYAVAGKMLMDTFPSLYWAPCAARCIDLMLEDFGKLEWIRGVIEQARSVTRFIYNQSAVLKLMRHFTCGNDILLHGATRSATDFTILKRMADFKLNLQPMVTSPDWIESPYSKQLGAMAAAEVINNRSFWSECTIITRLTKPLLHALNVASSRKKGAMGYVFAAIYRAKEAIKTALMPSDDYMVYWNIIDHRWQQQKHLYIQAAGFFLNPKFFYSNDGDVLNEIRSKMFDCIERLVPDTEVQDKIARELELYQSAAGDLGRKMAIRTRETLLPAEWWSVYGGGCPNLARLAIRILSQPCGIPVCKWNHVSFEKMHSSRNFLERQRMIDTVFVQCNLRLKQMSDEARRVSSGDAITSDNMNMLEDWVAENELCLENYGEMDWMSLVPNNPTPLTAASSSVDETEDLGTAFDDAAILNGLIQMYREEEGTTAVME
ncbi:hypothetical protein LINGRAHAP2_LOCUS26207 [Linum grandiflorum]